MNHRVVGGTYTELKKESIRQRQDADVTAGAELQLRTHRIGANKGSVRRKRIVERPSENKHNGPSGVKKHILGKKAEKRGGGREKGKGMSEKVSYLEKCSKRRNREGNKRTNTSFCWPSPKLDSGTYFKWGEGRTTGKGFLLTGKDWCEGRVRPVHTFLQQREPSIQGIKMGRKRCG